MKDESNLEWKVLGISAAWWEGDTRPTGTGIASGLMTAWARARLVELAMASGMKVYDQAVCGVADRQQVIAAFEKAGGEVRYHDQPWRSDHEFSADNETSLETVLAGPHAAVWVNFTPATSEVFCRVIAVGDLGKRLFDLACETVPLAPPKAPPELKDEIRPIFFLAASEMGMDAVPVGGVTEPLCRDNYPERVLRDFDAVVENLKAAHPSGRLTLLSGAHGTGKTHLLRGIVQASPDAMCLMIDPDMISGITRPELLSVLLRIRSRGAPNMPLVFLVEEGDRAIAARQIENLDHVQALLNLGGGLAGDMLNTHVILTTNARTGRGQLDIDPALQRKQRLTRHIELDGLTSEHAARIFSRLVPNETAPAYRDGVSLADVYDDAIRHGWKDPTPIVSEAAQSLPIGRLRVRTPRLPRV